MKKLNKKAETWGIVLFVGLVVGLIALSVIVSLVTTSTEYEQLTQQSLNVAPVPYNVTLTGIRPKALVGVTNLSDDSLNAGNYTDYVSVGKLQIDNNESVLSGVNVAYTHQQAGFISGTASIIALLLPLLFIVALIIFATGFIAK